MYGELVKELRDSAEWADRLALLMGRAEGDTHAPIMRKAADAIEQLSNAGSAYGRGWTLGYDAGRDENRPRWIPVTERLPKKSGVYLGWIQGDLTDPDDNPSAYPIEYDAEEEAFGWWKPYYDPDSLGRTGEEFIRYESATHWMPLPEPPKEET